MSGLFGESTGGGRYVVPPPYVRKSAFRDPFAEESRKILRGQFMDPSLVSPGMASPFRAQQLSLAESLTQRATGQSPGLAREMLKQQTQRNLAGIIGQTLANRAIPAGLASRMGIRTFGDVQREATAQGVLADLQERLAAEQSLGTLLERGRAGDFGAISALLAKNEADREAAMDFQRLLSQNYLTATGQTGAAYGDWQGRRAAGLSSLMGAGLNAAALGMMIPFLSDRRLKTDVESWSGS